MNKIVEILTLWKETQIRKCYLIAVTFTSEIPLTVCSGTKNDSIICV